MQKVQFTPIVEAKRTEEGGLNLYHAKEETAFFMIIQDEKGNRIYSFWECGQCGLTQMYRDREEELKRQPSIGF
jgi:hypothetical protein